MNKEDMENNYKLNVMIWKIQHIKMWNIITSC